MTDTVKILGQQAPAATTLTDLYTVPASTSTVISTISVCNRSSTPTAFRLSLAVAGAADAIGQYISFDTPIQGNDTVFLTLGIGLQTTDKLRCYATLATLTFTACGLEIT